MSLLAAFRAPLTSRTDLLFFLFSNCHMTFKKFVLIIDSVPKRHENV